MTAPHPSSHATLNPAPEPPPVSAAMALAHRKYWRFNLVLIAALMTLGFIVSFVLPLLAPTLAQIRVGGFRLPFYFGAQGAILIYLALIVVYIVLMQRADRQLQRALEADSKQRANADSTGNSTAGASADANAPAARGR
ncbi:DUF4212 domain-containing protein [Paraburkholderia susongensis]|uniref:Putative solute:sodium symporter small subunit n=1 Tax=Paraburkholderia susongensis TaxID=1515439 RepID=A0A1X7JKC1_9BURK|nr:DUF4212 domain-containing protein [Paraburkholderia susongensis]SMG28365.1 putative solute:sodium symporter small subunit [Paraburkholderia susongensis]